MQFFHFPTVSKNTLLWRKSFITSKSRLIRNTEGDNALFLPDSKYMLRLYMQTICIARYKTINNYKK